MHDTIEWYTVSRDTFLNRYLMAISVRHNLNVMGYATWTPAHRFVRDQYKCLLDSHAVDGNVASGPALESLPHVNIRPSISTLIHT
jgi:hypothetical protein